MKRYLWLLSLLVLILAGCGKERSADIATPQEITDKAILIIFPSVPSELCYADHMTEILNQRSDEISGTNPQVLSVEANVDCLSYGYGGCQNVALGKIDNKEIESINCFRDEGSKVCMFVTGDEYKDAEGETFDETCVLGIDK